MSLVGIARQARVEAEGSRTRACRRPGGRGEAPFVRVEIDAPALEGLGPGLRLLQQVGERGHRAVVQVGRAQPQSVERQVGVAVGLLEMAETVAQIAAKEE